MGKERRRSKDNWEYIGRWQPISHEWNITRSQKWNAPNCDEEMGEGGLVAGGGGGGGTITSTQREYDPQL